MIPFFKILFIFALIQFSAYAENWTTVSKLGTNQAFQLKSECERVTSSECFDLGNFPHEVYSVTQVERDDITKPVFTKLNVSSCLNLEDCRSKLTQLSCAAGDQAIIGTMVNEVYCAHHAGYAQKKVDIISLDNSKLTAYNAAQAAKKAALDEESAIQAKLIRMDAGHRIMAMIMLINDKKTLTTSQIGVMLLTYQDVKAALETGSLNTALALISTKVPDGVIMTEADKTAIVSAISKELQK